MLKIYEVTPEIAKLVKQNDGYCPCAIQKDEDTRCPCKEFREQTTPGECHCGRFAKTAVMRISGTLACSFVNGEGMRYVVFLQGCEHHCPGCHNPHTWDRKGGKDVPITELANDIRRRWLNDGLTLSGGEPFLQEEECMALLEELPDDLNVWVYTGYEYEDIKDRPLAKRANVLVTGPYVEALRCEGKPYGSSNQRVIRRDDSDKA